MQLPANADPHEPLLVPDVHRLEQMPCLPAWAASRIALLQTAPKRDPNTTQVRIVSTLPAQMLLLPIQRKALERHEMQLRQLCERTPANDAGAERDVFGVVMKMMLIFPAATQNDISAEARGEAYLIALQDVPPWAVSSAFRRWCRGECGTNSNGEQYDYRWCPAPAEFRRISRTELYKVKGRLDQARYLLAAEPRIEFSDEHCITMRRRLDEVFHGFSNPPVGSDGSGGKAGQKPVEGAYCGTQPKHSPA